MEHFDPRYTAEVTAIHALLKDIPLTTRAGTTSTFAAACVAAFAAVRDGKLGDLDAGLGLYGVTVNTSMGLGLQISLAWETMWDKHHLAAYPSSDRLRLMCMLDSDLTGFGDGELYGRDAEIVSFPNVLHELCYQVEQNKLHNVLKLSPHFHLTDEELHDISITSKVIGARVTDKIDYIASAAVVKITKRMRATHASCLRVIKEGRSSVDVTEWPRKAMFALASVIVKGLSGCLLQPLAASGHLTRASSSATLPAVSYTDMMSCGRLRKPTATWAAMQGELICMIGYAGTSPHFGRTYGSVRHMVNFICEYKQAAFIAMCKSSGLSAKGLRSVFRMLVKYTTFMVFRQSKRMSAGECKATTATFRQVLAACKSPASGPSHARETVRHSLIVVTAAAIDDLAASIPNLEPIVHLDSSDDDTAVVGDELHHGSASAGASTSYAPDPFDEGLDSGSDAEVESVASDDDEDGGARAAESFGDDSEPEDGDMCEVVHSAGVYEETSTFSRCCIC